MALVLSESFSKVENYHTKVLLNVELYLHVNNFPVHRMELEKIWMPELNLFCLVTDVYHSILHHLCYVFVADYIIQVAFLFYQEHYLQEATKFCNHLDYVLTLEHCADQIHYKIPHL